MARAPLVPLVIPRSGLLPLLAWRAHGGTHALAMPIPPSKISNRGRWALASAGSVVAIVGIVDVSGLSPAVLASEVRRAGIWTFGVVTLGWLLVVAMQTLRWRSVLAPVARRPFGELYLLRATGQLLNAFLPVRAGDLLRIELLSRRSGVPRATLVGLEVVDQTLDKMGWLPALGVVAVLGSPPAWLLRGAPFVVVLPVAVALAVMLSRRVERPPVWLASFRQGLDAHRLSTLVLVGSFLGPLPWLTETAALDLAARSAGLRVGAVQAFAMLTALNAAYALPVPGNAGTVETAVGGSLTAMGFPADIGVAFGLVYHLGQLAPALLVGVPGLLALRAKAVEDAAPRVNGTRDPTTRPIQASDD